MARRSTGHGIPHSRRSDEFLVVCEEKMQLRENGPLRGRDISNIAIG
jgi:hypothetical protein